LDNETANLVELFVEIQGDQSEGVIAELEKLG
jgi:translation initiation factor 1 (eIF-1/SUI1)